MPSPEDGCRCETWSSCQKAATQAKENIKSIKSASRWLSFTSGLSAATCGSGAIQAPVLDNPFERQKRDVVDIAKEGRIIAQTGELAILCCPEGRCIAESFLQIDANHDLAERVDLIKLASKAVA